MNSICIIQARVGSSRLRGKVLLPINSRTVIAEVIMRCCSIEVDEVIVAIPDTTENDPLYNEAYKYVDCFRGPEHDVLKRYFLAVKSRAVRYDTIMRITADCPLLSPKLCNAVLKSLGGYDYASNVPIGSPRTFPQGYDCEAFTAEMLTRAHLEARDTPSREHVTPFMRNGPFKRITLNSPWPLEGRLTLDTVDDYRTIQAYFNSKDST